MFEKIKKAMEQRRLEKEQQKEQEQIMNRFTYTIRTQSLCDPNREKYLEEGYKLLKKQAAQGLLGKTTVEDIERLQEQESSIKSFKPIKKK